MGSIRRNWTDKEKNQLRSWYGLLTMAQIGLLLGRTEGSVLQQIKSMGISGDSNVGGQVAGKAKINNMQAAMQFTLADAGFSITEIHTHFGSAIGDTYGATKARIHKHNKSIKDTQ